MSIATATRVAMTAGAILGSAPDDRASAKSFEIEFWVSLLKITRFCNRAGKM